jgi:hypothetical protein
VTGSVPSCTTTASISGPFPSLIADCSSPSWWPAPTCDACTWCGGLTTAPSCSRWPSGADWRASFRSARRRPSSRDRRSVDGKALRLVEQEAHKESPRLGAAGGQVQQLLREAKACVVACDHSHRSVAAAPALHRPRPHRCGNLIFRTGMLPSPGPPYHSIHRILLPGQLASARHRPSTFRISCQWRYCSMRSTQPSQPSHLQR